MARKPSWAGTTFRSVLVEKDMAIFAFDYGNLWCKSSDSNEDVGNGHSGVVGVQSCFNYLTVSLESRHHQIVGTCHCSCFDEGWGIGKSSRPERVVRSWIPGLEAALLDRESTKPNTPVYGS
jgi:hypothetical protein